MSARTLLLASRADRAISRLPCVRTRKPSVTSSSNASRASPALLTVCPAAPTISPARLMSEKDEFFISEKLSLDHIFGTDQVFASFHGDLSESDFDFLAETTLEYLADYLEESIDKGGPECTDFDISLAQGVLTINLNTNGTYVINKQTPNRQIWLSSPVSGPKRYDFVDKSWKYRGETMTSLLTEEFCPILGPTVDFYFINEKVKRDAENFRSFLT